jgi:hypothetical protein
MQTTPAKYKQELYTSTIYKLTYQKSNIKTKTIYIYYD